MENSNLKSKIDEFIDSLDEDTKAILKGLGHFKPELTTKLLSQLVADINETTETIADQKTTKSK
jgi:hypothetical protein